MRIAAHGRGFACGLLGLGLVGPTFAAEPSAFEQMLEAGRAGDVEAQRRLGGAYYFGRRVERDFEAAASWWERAADQGDAASAYNLSTLYRNGEGVDEDPFEAARWLREARDGSPDARAELERLETTGALMETDPVAAYAFYRVDAEAGHAASQRLVGLMLREGRGVERDAAAAFRWLEKAAQQGDAEAQGALGSLYDEGRGVARDPLQALVWFEKAAAQGHAGAQFNLGSMYLHGNGVPADHAEAVMWLTLCADEVYSARYLLHSEQDRIAPADLAKGRAMAEARRRTPAARAGGEVPLPGPPDRNAP
jgi:TPR repeat protein